MKSIAMFRNPANTQTLRVVAQQGKTGFNVKCTVKGTEANAKALTGARSQFTDAKGATAAFERLTEEAKKQGWITVHRRSREAFSAIPKAN